MVHQVRAKSCRKAQAALRSATRHARNRAILVKSLVSQVSLMSPDETILPSHVRKGRDGTCRCSCFDIPKQVPVALRYLLRVANVATASSPQWNRISNGSLESITLGAHGVGDKMQPLSARLKHKGLSHLVCVAESVQEYLDVYVAKCLGAMGIRDSGELRWTMGFLQSLDSDHQRPHCDFDWTMLRKGGRTRVAPAEMMPFVLEFPLCADGLQLELFPETENGGGIVIDGKSPLFGHVLSLPIGKAVVFRGDVVHAGGFKRGRSLRGKGQVRSPSSKLYVCAGNNLRCHIYIYQRKGVQHQVGLTTNYRAADGTELLHTHQSQCPTRRFWQELGS